MSIAQYIEQVIVNSEPVEWSEHSSGKLLLEQPLVSGDSILLVSKNEDAWRSRRIFIGPGGTADLYLHPDTLKPPKVTVTRTIPPILRGSELSTAIKQLGLSPMDEKALLDIEAEIRKSYEDTIAELEAKIEAGRKALK